MQNGFWYPEDDATNRTKDEGKLKILKYCRAILRRYSHETLETGSSSDRRRVSEGGNKKKTKWTNYNWIHSAGLAKRRQEWAAQPTCTGKALHVATSEHLLGSNQPLSQQPSPPMPQLPNGSTRDWSTEKALCLGHKTSSPWRGERPRSLVALQQGKVRWPSKWKPNSAYRMSLPLSQEKQSSPY